MNTTNSLFSWPYEQRFELTVQGSLLAAAPAVWKSAIELAASTVTSHGKTPECHYYLLNSGFLLVFDHRAVLVSNTAGGLMEPATYLLAALEEKIITHATLTRRYPIGEELLGLAYHELDESLLPPVVARLECGTIHSWPMPLQAAIPEPQTLTLMMHGLSASATALELRSVLAELSPQLLVLSNQTSKAGQSVVAVGGQQYVSIQSAGLNYVSIEISVGRWLGVEGLISQLLMLYRPEVVAPIWYGQPLEHHFGNSCNNDVLP
jgi:hypothetical protein